MKRCLRAFPEEVHFWAEKSWRCVVLHHSEIPDGSESFASFCEHIDEMHRGFGWDGVGYHFVLSPDGSLEVTFRWLEQREGAHTRGKNECIGICLVGNFDRDRPTPPQVSTLRKLLRELLTGVSPNLSAVPPQGFHDHREFSPKSCPGKNLSVHNLVKQLAPHLPSALSCVVFDMDNTLFRSKLNFTELRESLGLPPTTPLGIIEELRRRHPPKRAKELMRKLEELEVKGVSDGKVEEGAVELVRFLKDRNVKVCLVTRNSRSSVRKFLEKWVGPEFDVVISREDAPPKPSPHPTLKALELAGASPGESISVGDYEYDRMSSRSAGVLFVGVKRRFLAPPHLFFRDLKDLLFYLRCRYTEDRAGLKLN